MWDARCREVLPLPDHGRLCSVPGYSWSTGGPGTNNGLGFKSRNVLSKGRHTVQVVVYQTGMFLCRFLTLLLHVVVEIVEPVEIVELSSLDPCRLDHVALGCDAEVLHLFNLQVLSGLIVATFEDIYRSQIWTGWHEAESRWVGSNICHAF